LSLIHSIIEPKVRFELSLFTEQTNITSFFSIRTQTVYKQLGSFMAQT